MEASSDLCRWATVARTASPGWCRIVSRTRRRPLLDRFREHFADFDGLVPAYLDSLNAGDPLHVGAVEWISLDRWHAGRVVIIGDAAHAAPPHMGEGGSLAAEDALVLAQEIGDRAAAGPVSSRSSTKMARPCVPAKNRS